MKRSDGTTLSFDEWRRLVLFALHSGEDHDAFYDIIYGDEAIPYWQRLADQFNQDIH